MSKRSILWVIFITLLACGLIFFKFNQIPAGLALDELEFARLATLLEDTPYTPYHEYATGHATLYFYIILGFFKTFGTTPLVLRLPSALAGIVGIVVFYYITDLVFKQKTLKVKIVQSSIQVPYAFILGFILLTLRWYFSFARFSFEATFLLTLELISLFAILRYAKGKSLLLLIFSGIFAGFAYNSYTPGRFFVLIPLLCLVLNPKIRTMQSVLIYLASFTVAILPLTLHLQENPDFRVMQQLYLVHDKLSIGEKLSFLTTNIINNAQMFFLSGHGDFNGRHNYPFKPALNPAIFMFFAIGLIRAIRNWKDNMNKLFIAYFVLGMIPTLLTYPHENPNMLRTFTVLPSVVYFIGQGIMWIKDYMTSKITKKQFTVYIGTVLVLIIIASSFYELRTYFVFQKLVYEQAFDIIDGFAGIDRFLDPY